MDKKVGEERKLWEIEIKNTSESNVEPKIKLNGSTVSILVSSTISLKLFP